MRAAVRLLWPLIAATVIVTLPAADARAQSGRLHGRVVDSETGQPIRSATVVAESTAGIPGQFTAISDDKGRFAMLGLRTGIWILSARAQGYELMAGTTRVQSLGQNPAVEFKLTRTPEPVLSPLARLDLEAYQNELRAAQGLLDASHADEAIAAYEGLLTRLPTLTTLHFKIAEAYLLKQDTGRALESYDRVPDTDSQYERARTAMGMIELRRGNLDAAEKMLAAAGNAPGAAPETLAALGDVKRAQQQGESAATYYQKAAEGDPSWAGPYLKLAQVASDRGDIAAAAKYLERAIAIDPNGPDAGKARTMLDGIRRLQ